MLRAILAALALSACAATPDPSSEHNKRDVDSDRQQERVRQMQDEFNTTFPDA